MDRLPRTLTASEAADTYALWPEVARLVAEQSGRHQPDPDADTWERLAAPWMTLAGDLAGQWVPDRVQAAHVAIQVLWRTYTGMAYLQDARAELEGTSVTDHLAGLQRQSLDQALHAARVCVETALTQLAGLCREAGVCVGSPREGGTL